MPLAALMALASILQLWAIPGRHRAPAGSPRNALVGVGDADGPERGDVPGWVMITLMSAVLVAGLLAIAGPALEGLFRAALDQVNPGK
ncbi:MAG TPA: hypothetical protein VGN49_13205 [Micrococcaceae bacterium]|nr:hypothetical protein [Micrococcaceae bacterium]